MKRRVRMLSIGEKHTWVRRKEWKKERGRKEQNNEQKSGLSRRKLKDKNAQRREIDKGRERDEKKSKNVKYRNETYLSKKRR